MFRILVGFSIVISGGNDVVYFVVGAVGRGFDKVISFNVGY